MTPDEMLARAWLALAGWREHMVTSRGVPVQSWWLRDPEAMARLDDQLPALNSPANWGWWRAFAEQRYGVPPRLSFDASLPCELMRWLLERAREAVPFLVRPDLPEEALTWWMHEDARRALAEEAQVDGDEPSCEVCLDHRTLTGPDGHVQACPKCCRVIGLRGDAPEEGRAK